MFRLQVTRVVIGVRVTFCEAIFFCLVLCLWMVTWVPIDHSYSKILLCMLSVSMIFSVLSLGQLALMVQDTCDHNFVTIEA